MTNPAEGTLGTILPCPFCGSEPTVMGSGEGHRGLMIHCIGRDCPNPSVSYYMLIRLTHTNAESH